MSTVPIRIINLAARTDRRQHMAAELDRLAIRDYAFFTAVDGTAQPDHPLFGHYDARARQRVRGRGRDLKPSQLGCFASHYLLWQACATSGRPLIVLEDDAILLAPFALLVDRAADLAQRWPLIWLHDRDRPGPDPMVEVGHAGPFTLYRKLKGHYRTVAYLISPAGALALLAYCRTWIYPVDDTMIRFYDHGVDSILIQPSCVTHDNDSASDITGPPDEAVPPLTDRLRREFFKGSDQLRRQWYNLRHHKGHRSTTHERSMS